MAPRKKWYMKEERKDAKGMAKEKGCFAWHYVRKVTPRRKDLKPYKLEGIYVGMQLPAELRKDGTQAKLIHDPER